MTVIEARGLRKAFGATIALDSLNLRVDEGRILGLIGPNGAGKSTALNAILGLTEYQGELRVLGRDPWLERDQLMRDICFISDVAVLPRWMRVSQSLDYVAGVHPRFDRAKAEGFLAKTDIKRASRVRELSKGRSGAETAVWMDSQSLGDPRTRGVGQERSRDDGLSQVVYHGTKYGVAGGVSGEAQVRAKGNRKPRSARIALQYLVRVPIGFQQQYRHPQRALSDHPARRQHCPEWGPCRDRDRRLSRNRHASPFGRHFRSL